MYTVRLFFFLLNFFQLSVCIIFICKLHHLGFFTLFSVQETWVQSQVVIPKTQG